MTTQTVSDSRQPAVPKQQIVSLPEVPADIYGISREYQQARSWEIILDWCMKHGLPMHAYEHRDQYDKLNGPQMIAQWIIDMKSALYFFEQAITKDESCADVK